MKLLLSAVTKLIFGIALVAVLVFLPAGTFVYPGALLFCGLLFVPTLILGVVMYFKAPELLKKRIDAKEKEKVQKGVIAVSGLAFIASFVISGLDFRFGWSAMPTWVVIAASIIFLITYGIYAEVLRENAYLSRIIEVQEGQKVIDTGLYGIVRHPMYTATVFMFGAIPLILGSWYGLIPMVAYPVVIILRIKNEEEVLEKGLEGYTDYKKKVRFRLIPFIW